jgi:hypothetical protein
MICDVLLWTAVRYDRPGFVLWLEAGCFANNDRFPRVRPFMERLLSGREE